MRNEIKTVLKTILLILHFHIRRKCSIYYLTETYFSVHCLCFSSQIAIQYPKKKKFTFHSPDISSFLKDLLKAINNRKSNKMQIPDNILFEDFMYGHYLSS